VQQSRAYVGYSARSPIFWRCIKCFACGKIASSRNTGAQKLHSRVAKKKARQKPGWVDVRPDRFTSIASRDKLN
jgi:hypothetical protein